MPASIRLKPSPEEREKLAKAARSTKRGIREKTRARILLLSDSNREQGPLSVEAICEQLRTSPATVTRVKKMFLARGREGIKRKQQAKRNARVIDGEMEAFLIATVCGAAPEGRKRWTLE